MSLAFARAAMEVEDADSPWDAREGEIMMEIENYSQHRERIRFFRWVRQGFLFVSGALDEGEHFIFLWTRSFGAKKFCRTGKERRSIEQDGFIEDFAVDSW